MSEGELLDKACFAEGAERDRLIAELDVLPPGLVPRYARWLIVQRVGGPCEWNENGPIRNLSPPARAALLLSAASYALVEIWINGFDQLFAMGSGVIAPEAVVCLKRMGFTNGANIFQMAMKKFGPKYPRAQEVRVAWLKQFQEFGRRTNPFSDLNKRMCVAVGRVEFNERAERWLEEQCGVETLADTVDGFPRVAD